MLTEADVFRRAGADLTTLLVAGGQQGFAMVGSGTLPNGAPMGPADLPAYSLDHNWSRMEKLVLEALQSGSDSALLGQLLRAGIVRRLARLVVDFAPLALSYEYRGLCDFDPLIASFTTWFRALHILSIMADRIIPDVSRDVDQGLAEWKLMGKELIASFRACRLFRPYQVGPSDDGDIDQLRYWALRTISPVLNVYTNAAVISTSHLENARAAVPLISAIRSTIQTPPSFPSVVLELAERSGQLLAHCLRLINIQGNFRQYSVSNITGTSYEKLVEQCLFMTGEGPEQVRNRMEQVGILVQAVIPDDSEALWNVLYSQHFIAKTARLVRIAKTSTGVSHLTDPSRTNYDWYDSLAMAWRQVLFRAFSKPAMDPKFAVEAMDANLLYLAEWLSVTANPSQLRDIEGIIISFMAIEDQRNRLKTVKQFKIILYRMSRPHIRSIVTKTWKDTIDKYGPPTQLALEPANLCGLPGCESTKAAKLMCSRCKNTPYCSAECQTLDWKTHKTYCKR